ncbi:MAG TPA: hypothetical protein GXX28_10155 [Firmicutes bacterium]|nr:hypothetical protein [Bacillota bacterium]
MRPRLRRGLVAAALLSLAGLAGLGGAGCTVPVLAPAQPADLTPAVQRVESEINAALLRRGVAPVEVRTGLKTAERRLSRPVQVRWLHRSFTLVAEPTFSRLRPADYLEAVREGARRAGARVSETAFPASAEHAGSGARLAIRLPVRVWGRTVTVDALEITILPPPPLGHGGNGPAVGGGASLRPQPPRWPGKPLPEPVPDPGRPGKTRVALIIDDWGYEQPFASDFFSLPVPLTMAVIPFTPDSRRLAEEGFAHGWQVLVHLPLQPESKALDRAEGMVRVTLNDAELRRTIERDLDAVPHAAGVNNHMGSLATRDRRVMEAVLSAVAERGWFFIDSRTTAGSVATDVARELGLPYGENFVFLDNRADVDYIRRSLRILVKAAERNGYAIGIGHVRRETLAALRAELPVLLRNGVRFVPVGDVVRRDFRYRSLAVPRVEEPAPVPQPAPRPALQQAPQPVPRPSAAPTPAAPVPAEFSPSPEETVPAPPVEPPAELSAGALVEPAQASSEPAAPTSEPTPEPSAPSPETALQP